MIQSISNCFINKNIIITGASSGIGKEIAIFLSRLGAHVILIARNTDKLQDTLSKVEASKGSIFAYDLQRLDGINELIDSIVLSVGKIYGLVHAAGIQVTLPYKRTSIDIMKEVFNINTFAFFELVKAITRKDLCDEGCSLVAVSSVYSRIGSSGLSVYGASKAALESMVKSLALELSKKKIRVNSISPAYIKAGMLDNLRKILSDDEIDALEKRIPLGFGESEDVTNAVAFLLSTASKWITGTSLIVDGGFLAQ